MSASLVEQIANAVLYEGYILYPYRPSSVKNRQRWTFGGIYPRAYSEAQRGTDAWTVQVQCLVQAGSAAILAANESGQDDPTPSLDVRVRFLHLIERRAQDAVGPSWQEAAEREVCAADLALEALAQQPARVPFAFPAWHDVADGVVREQQAIEGTIEVAAEPIHGPSSEVTADPISGPGVERLFKLTVRISNLTPLDAADPSRRDDALMQALISAHAILTVRGGELVSLLDPPPGLEAAVASCTSAGLWPVLVGEDGQRDTLLASPIILYDYPQIAPESPGDLFDGTEIDEILTLRILTMTDAEKAEMRQSDERARALLERTDALSAEDLMGLHGTMRNLRRAGSLLP